MTQELRLDRCKRGPNTVLTSARFNGVVYELGHLSHGFGQTGPGLLAITDSALDFLLPDGSLGSLPCEKTDTGLKIRNSLAYGDAQDLSLKLTQEEGLVVIPSEADSLALLRVSGEDLEDACCLTLSAARSLLKHSERTFQRMIGSLEAHILAHDSVMQSALIYLWEELRRRWQSQRGSLIDFLSLLRHARLQVNAQQSLEASLFTIPEATEPGPNSAAQLHAAFEELLNAVLRPGHWQEYRSSVATFTDSLGSDYQWAWVQAGVQRSRPVVGKEKPEEMCIWKCDSSVTT
ncbi:MAG: hypothetical protein P1V97_27175 [Planctomycetota bacterium]|nr:hypothetical protein [Planctomycetota bacterium]